MVNRECDIVRLQEIWKVVLVTIEKTIVLTAANGSRQVDSSSFLLVGCELVFFAIDLSACIVDLG